MLSQTQAFKIGPPVPPKVKARLTRERRKEARANPAPLPIAGKSKGMLASFEQSLRKRSAPVQVTTADAGVREHDWARSFYRSWRVGDLVYVPLFREPHRAVKVRLSDWRRVQEVNQLQGTRWERDETTGAIRAFKVSASGDRAQHTFDVVAALYDLNDGDSYTMPDPLDMMTVRLHRR